MDNETITYRPARPAFDRGQPDQWKWNFYLVYRGGEPSSYGGEMEAAYDALYFPSVGHVLDDMLSRRAQAAESDISDPASGEEPHDFVIWREGRIMATVHYAYNRPGRVMIQTFEERDERGFSNDKGEEFARGGGWPTRAQWLADGGLVDPDTEIILRPWEARLPDGSTRVYRPGEWQAEAAKLATA